MNFAGITVNGSNPYDIQVKNDRFYQRIIHEPALGLGEAYMDNWWECRALDQFIAKVLCANLGQVLEKEWRITWNLLTAKFFNQQSSKRAFMVGQRHYDIGNDLYQGMLDKQMQYTCGYWKDATTLDQAQEAKLALVCRKLKLEPGMKVLELGCGFGGFAHYAAPR